MDSKETLWRGCVAETSESRHIHFNVCG